MALARKKRRPRGRARRNPDWGENVKHWTPARRAAWKRTSEAAKFRTFKIGEAIDRRRAVYLKRHGSPGPGVMPPQLAARHAAYRRSWNVEMRRQAREAREEARERRKARRRNPMAKSRRSRTPAQKAAFRRMIAGLKAYKSGGRKLRRKARRKAKRATVVVVSNPRRKRRRNPTRGVTHMAKRRRTRRHRAVAHRTNPHRRRSHRRRNPHRRHHRRRNPGTGNAMSIVKNVIATAIPAIAAGGVMALIDNKLLGSKALPVQVIGKLAAAAGVGMVLRSRPRTAAVAMGAMLGSLGYQLAAQLGGGMVTTNPTQTANTMQALVRAGRGSMSSLVQADGTLRTQPSLHGMGDMGGTAIPTSPIYDPITLG